MAKQQINILESIVVFVIGALGAGLGLLVSIAVPAAVVAVFIWIVYLILSWLGMF
ncbi:hypothetical protein [uncultured Parasutterella sp.]|uniref:hypothetical protein n=1 Tax=uncultured Parasutterella sp. TaxID=1263098 RepID=UPI0025B6ADAC|nr:hypothetical protein [uncultured Parasutterella sp.]